jgi:hypothetical protein
MLSFMTEIPLEHGHDADEFLRTIQRWILGSPHTCLSTIDFSAHEGPDFPRIQRANEALDISKAIADKDQIAGIRYQRRDDGLDWTTTAVFSRSSQDSWVGIRISCESAHPAVRLPPAKKPVLIRTLLKDLGGGLDGPLRVDGKPKYLYETDIDLAARLILGKAGCRLPVVYVSSGFHGDHVLDVVRLAADLGGMAHVVVEPNRPFSLRLRFEVDSENVYGGTIGVYWPDGGGRRSFFLGREFESPADLAHAVFDEVRTALTNRRGLNRCTWASLQETISRQTIQGLKAEGSQEVEKYIANFDNELAAKDEKLDEAELEIKRLRSELRIYEARVSSQTGGFLKSGNEQDLYPNEALGILRRALEDAATRVPADSRRLHVIGSILEANPLGEDLSDTMRDQLKDLLKGARGLNAKIRRGLQEMGFSITEEGKHHKLVFQGDDRYTFTFAKSASDHRGGMNSASDIGRLLF